MKGCKNIWIFNHYAITPDLPGGTRHFDFGKELIKRGFNVTIFASSFIHGIFEDKKLKNGENWKIENYEGVNFVWIKTFPYNRNNWRRLFNILSYSWRAYSIGKKMSKLSKSINVQPPSVIIGSSFHPLAAFVAYKLSKFYKVPFVLEIRDLYPQSLIDLNRVSKNNLISKIINLFMDYLYKRADKIIILMPNAYEVFKSLGVRREKIIWIPNGINLMYLKDVSYGSIARNDKCFKVTFAGSLNNANSIDTLILAAKIIQDLYESKILFEVYGDGKEKSKLLSLKESAGLYNLKFLGVIPKSDVYKVLCGASILWVGQKRRNIYKYGVSFNKLFDYLAAGKPIIFSSNASNNPVAEAGAGLTVPPEDPEAVAEAIIKLYNMSEEERERMGKNGRKYVEKYHSIPVLVDKLEKVIKEVCNKKTID